MKIALFIALSLMITALWLSQAAQARIVFNDLPESLQPLAELRPEPAPASAAQSASLEPTANKANKTTKKRPKKKPKKRQYWATAWVNHADNAYVVGEHVMFYVKAKRDVYITLLDVGTSGQVSIIFPNKHQQDNFVRAGQVVEIPGPEQQYLIQAHPPAGTELVKLIATQQPHAFFDPAQIAESEHFSALLQDPRSTAKQLKSILNRRHKGRWNEYAKVIRIVAKR